jgi:DNA glycosylase AlkZ-like
MENLDRNAVRRALWVDRTLVKTWAMRGTLHLLPAREYPLWSAALATSPRYLRPRQWKKHFGLTLDDLERLSEAAAVVLEGRLLTRDALAAEVAAALGDAPFAAKIAASSWGTVLKPAAFTGRLCFGPNEGPRVQFTNPKTWLALSATPIDSAAATREVTRRFLRAYAPATRHDLARWWAGTMATIRQWIEALGDEVCSIAVGGTEALMLASDVRAARVIPPSRVVRLLPAFDPYVVGASYHAERLMPGPYRNRIFRPQGWISPVLLVGGRLEGVWRHDVVGKRVRVVIEPFVRQPAWVKRAARDEAEKLAVFLGGSAQFSWRG